MRQQQYARTYSAPTFLIPSKDMGRYEEAKSRRASEPLPPRVGPSPLPGSVTGPQQTRRQSSGGEGGLRRPERKSRSYAAYSLSHDCEVHGPLLRKADQERRISLQSRGAGERRNSLTPAKRAQLEQWALQCPPLSRPSLSPPLSRPLSPQQTSSVHELARPVSRMAHYSDGEKLTYQSTQYINSRRRSSQRRPGSLRSYRSFCSDLTEALFEVEEESDEDEKEEKGSEKTGLSEDEKQHRLDWDSLGVLGLASKLSRDTKSRQEVFLANDSFIRKSSLSSHAM